MPSSTVASSQSKPIRVENDSESAITQLWSDETWQSGMTDIERCIWGRAASECIDFVGVHSGNVRAELKFQLGLLRAINDEYRERRK